MALLDKFVVRATAKSVRRKHILLRVSSVTLMICVLLLLVFYGFAHFANLFGTFTVKIKDMDDTTGITLSNDSTFEDTTAYIAANAIDKMDNITETWLPTDIDEIDGPHNGENYIAHTFYLKNVGTLDINYQAEIKILSVKKEADEAIRVKLYKNGEPTLYAKKQKGQEIPEPDTTPFYSIDKVMSQEYLNFKVGEVDKYTIVIWLEGNDPECVNNIIGGRVKLEMHFKITEQLDD